MTIKESIIKLKENKTTRILALKKCDTFIAKATDEAAWDPLSFSFFGKMREAAILIPQEFEKIDSSSIVKAQDRRIQPYIRSQLFISLISEVEDFIKTSVQIVLRKYPEKIGKTTITINDMISRGYEPTIEFAINKKLNDILYLPPKKYGEEICNFISLNYELLKTSWIAFIEMKARRDCGVHNNWIKNAKYMERVSEVGGNVTTDEFLGISNQYFENSLKEALSIIDLIANHCDDKFSETE